MNTAAPIDAQLAVALAAHRHAATRDGFRSLADRLDRLRRLEALPADNEDDFFSAMDADFAGRNGCGRCAGPCRS